MKQGTPQFVGARLREGREARGLTAVALSELLGVSRAAVSQYEAGTVTPRTNVLERITQVLNLPPQFFIRPVVEQSPTTIFYRSLSTATRIARSRVERRFLWLTQAFVPYLRGFVDLPEVNLPRVELPQDPMALTANQIEHAAGNLRRFWGLGDGPISNVVWLLENNGVIVTRGETGTDSLDSFSAWIDELPCIFLGSDKKSAARSRFDAAHELAHLIMHRNVDRGRFSHTTDHQVLEKQADRFGSAFLLPATAFTRDVYTPTLDTLRILKSKWVISISMMIHRAQDLDLVTADQAKTLWIAHSRRRWNRAEPLDDELPIEEPQLQRRAFELLLSEGVQTRSDVLEALPYAPADIEELAMLPSYTLTVPPPIVHLSDFAKPPSDSPRNGRLSGAGIIQFPEIGSRQSPA